MTKMEIWLLGPIYISLIQLFACVDSIHSNFSTKARERSAFLRRLLEDYDSRISPSFFSGEPTHVDCDVYISSFDSISESTMDYVVSIFLRQLWRDDRLDFSSYSSESQVVLDEKLVDSIWVPDLFFSNEKKAYFHQVTKPNRFIRVYNNGSIYYSARLSLTLSCPMKLQKFPLDTQICSMTMESYAYTTDIITLRWREYDPVQISPDLELPQFDLAEYEVKDCLKDYVTAGNFSCLRVDFTLVRDMGYYMIQTYVPSALIVMLSWVSFWISVDAVPARISLGVLTILTMTTQTTGARQNLPRVSYVKAIDVWMSTCLFFVFSALLEFAMVNVMSRKELRRAVTMKERRHHTRGAANGSGGEAADMIDQPDSKYEKVFTMDKKRARFVDKIARRIFPASFLIFNCVYWLTYIFWGSDFV